jgi:hypothetical protein
MVNRFKPTAVAIAELCSHSGAFDGFVQQGMELIESTLLISDEEAERLARNIGALAEGYRTSDRLAPEICMGFGAGTLLVVWGNTGGVTLRFRRGIERIESVIADCRIFLKQVLDDTPPEPVEVEIIAAPVEEIWKLYEPRLLGLLSSVVSRSQASRIIQRILVTMELTDNIPNQMLPEITREVLGKIPDRRKREALAAEARDELEHCLNS